MEGLAVFIVTNNCFDDAVNYLINHKVPVVCNKERNFIHADKGKLTEEIIQGVLSQNNMYSICEMGDAVYMWHKGKVCKLVPQE